MNTKSFRQKRGRTIQFVIGAQFKSLHLWWFRVAFVPVDCAAYVARKHQTCMVNACFRAIRAPIKTSSFSGKYLYLLDRRQLTASITTAWLHSRWVQVLNYLLACGQDLSQTEIIWHLMGQKIQYKMQNCQIAEIRQNWDDILLPKLQRLVSSVPRRIWTVVKRFYTAANITPSQLF